MEIVEPYATLVDVPDMDAGIALLRKIEWAGRISHRSEDAQTDTSWERFLRSVVLGHGDWSIVEHASVTVDAVIDRGIQQEWTRHRLFSPTIESTRFVNYEKKLGLSFIMPLGVAGVYQGYWTGAMVGAEHSYKNMLESGYAPQIARSVLPLALASRCIFTSNLRNWRHFLNLRTTKESHPQMRQVTIPLLEEFKQKIPILFEDIESMSSQRDATKKPR